MTALHRRPSINRPLYIGSFGRGARPPSKGNADLPDGGPHHGHEAAHLPSPVHIRGTVAAIVDQPDDLRELRTFHKALADVNRLRIVRRLADGPATVGELIDTVGLSQPLVSWHVGRLKAAGVIETQRTGREVSCRLRPNVFDEVEGRERILLGVPGLGLVAGAGPTAGASSIAAVSAVGQPGQPAPPPAPRPAEAR